MVRKQKSLQKFWQKFEHAQLAEHGETVAEPKIMTEDAKYGRSAITDEPFESLKARFLET